MLLTFHVEQKVILLIGPVASNRNSYILFTGVSVENSFSRTAAADGFGLPGRTNVHIGIDLTSGGGVLPVLLSGEVDERQVDRLTAGHSDEPRT